MDIKVALCLIVKGSDSEADHLKRCLTSVKGHVDGIFLNVNAKPGHKPSKKVMRVAREFTNNVITTEWHDNFAEARSVNFAQVPADYTHIMWLDTDDVVDHPDKIRKLCAASSVDGIFVDYLYDRDDAGNPTTVHMVNRIVRNNGAFVWKGSIHETLIETRGAAKGSTTEMQVIHQADETRKDQSTKRNIVMLKKQIDSEADNPDPRTIYYLARAYADDGDHASAKPLFEMYLEMSGWDQERSAAHKRLGAMYEDEGDTTTAKHHYMLAIGEDPDNPEPRIAMGGLEFKLKQYKKAAGWLEGVLAMEKNRTTLERNPRGYTFMTHWMLSETYVNMGGEYLDKAYDQAKKALSYRKKDKTVKEFVQMIEHVLRQKKLVESVIEIAKALKKGKEDDKIKLLAQAAPKLIEDNPLIIRLREPDAFTWPRKSVAIFCGSGVIEEWGPWSLKDGIGGSEEAVIRISKHLANLGYKVTVFASVGNNAGLHEGVMWRNHEECNLDDNFDVFIAWRAPFLFDKKINARKNYLWLHDVMEPGEFTPERIANFDKCIVLSKYHRSLFPMIPDEKIMLSANGIDPLEFMTGQNNIGDVEIGGDDPAEPNEKIYRLNDAKRDPHKMIYTSSHVRGLAYLYRIWPDVKRAVPDATLDVYYGRESYDTVHRGNPERIQWMDSMIAKAKELDGVTDHGKVGQDEIVRHTFESGLWVYPCPFPEISCITAMKMQAGGAVPVASNYAALEETIQYGHKQELGEFDDEDLEKYKQSLIWWLTHPEEQEKVRPEMMAWSRKHYDWRNVAEQWVGEFER